MLNSSPHIGLSQTPLNLLTATSSEAL